LPQVLAIRAQVHYNHGMSAYENESFAEHEESGSDELLAADELRLPEGANTLVRLHALRAWLERKRTEGDQQVGTAVLAVQMAMSDQEMGSRPRRRFGENNAPLVRARATLLRERLRQSAYEQASLLLEECVAHTTTGERLLVEYYLSLGELVTAGEAAAEAPWQEAMQDVLHRVEQVGSPGEETT
jgi:hypothetical protein